MTNKNKIIQEWLDKAQGDFDTAKALLSLDVASTYDNICFSCQQCIEKLLKAKLLALDVRPPQSHNLTKLSQMIEAVMMDWHIDEAILEELTMYAVEFRYPGHTASKKEAEQALQACSNLREQLLKLFTA